MTTASPPIGGKGLTRKQIADANQISLRGIERASFICKHGIPELEACVESGRLRLHPAEKIARLPREQQAAALAEALLPKKRTRPTWELQHDYDKLVGAVNHMLRRWTDRDRKAMGLMLHDIARQLAESDEREQEGGEQ